MKVALCTLDEIPTEGSKIIDLFGREALVYQVDGRRRALMNTCMHLGGPLEQHGDRFVCPGTVRPMGAPMGASWKGRDDRTRG